LIGLFSGLIRQSPFSEPLIALVAGVLLSPLVLNELDPARWGNQERILEQAARLTLAIGLMSVALRIPKDAPFRHWRLLVVLLGLVMPLMWMSSAVLIYLILGVPWLSALLIGAVVTPTDPVVSSTIVTGQVAKLNLPAAVRHTISAESGFNDGLAYPFVFLPILLLTRPNGEAWREWLTRTVLWEVIGAALVGVLLGIVAGFLVRWVKAKHLAEQTSILAVTIALSFVALGVGRLIGTDGILAVFVAGIAFDTVVSGNERAEEERIQEAVTRFFILPIFVLLGLALPWSAWRDLGWKGPALVVAILLFRRIPAMLAVHAWLGDLRDLPTTLFTGWFGPIGVAALYYAIVAKERAGLEQAWVVGSLLICSSVVVHGLTGTAFTHFYGRYTGETAITSSEAGG
ncbi:MAG: cation:proton antiporter, partial [Thermomicrobiales bacterium]